MQVFAQATLHYNKGTESTSCGKSTHLLFILLLLAAAAGGLLRPPRVLQPGAGVRKQRRQVPGQSVRAVSSIASSCSPICLRAAALTLAAGGSLVVQHIEEAVGGGQVDARQLLVAREGALKQRHSDQEPAVVRPVL